MVNGRRKPNAAAFGWEQISLWEAGTGLPLASPYGRWGRTIGKLSQHRSQRRWCRTIGELSQQPSATALVPDHWQTVPTTARNGVGACRRPALPWPPGGPFVNPLYYTPAAEKNPQFCYIPYNIFYNFFLFFRLFRALVRGCTGGRTGWSRCSTPLASIRPRTPVANCRGRNRARVLATAPQGS